MVEAATGRLLGAIGTPLLWVMLGGAVGAGTRFAVTEAVAWRLGRDWTWLATLLVNVAGCLLLGWLVGRSNQTIGDVLERGFLRGHPLMTAGVCGALTTFSTFALEVVQLGTKRPALAAGLVALHLTLGIFAMIAGLSIGRAG